MTTTLHAHVSTAAADCDGPMYRTYVESLNDSERAMHDAANGVNDFHDIVFKERVLGNHVSFCPDGSVRVNVRKEGFNMSEATEEGYRSADVRWCEDADCDPNAASQRDVFAEQMGY
jgi:hypothetical protein